MRAIVGLILGLCAFGAAQAADLTDPVWDRAPDQDDWAKAYPAHAAQAGIAGAVKMKCAATSAGQLSDCSVIQETPTGEGFGAAALSLAAGMALNPTDATGRSIAGRNLIVPVRFEPAMLHNPGTIIGHPDWLRRPTNDEMLHFVPANAGNAAGSTSIDCVVSTRGLLEKCSVKAESPAGHGFGAAALAMSSVFLMRPMTLDGLPVGGASVEIPIYFASGLTGGGSAGDQLGTRIATRADAISVLRAAPWMTTPTADALSAAFPKSAIGKTSAAHVVLRCGFRDDGALKSCDSLSETPDGQGFAGAAKALTKDFRAYVNPQVDKLGSLKVDIPFDFRDPNLPAPPTEVYDPMWLTRVSPESVAKVFPPAAIAAGLSTGVGTVECTVKHDGGLTECAVVSETPAGMGFGTAALQVASVMKMNPWTAQGDPVDGAHVRLPIRLQMPREQPAAVTPQVQVAPAKP
jgi:TonB family protein